MFRFLQACYWTFFCRREKPDTVPSKIHPYRIIPKGWCVRQEKPDDEVYNVSQVFLLNEDLLACAAVESDDHYQLPQFWLLKGSRLVINHVGDQMVTVVTRVFDGVPFFITFDKLAEMTRLNDCP
jgi:hypothetical protein